VTLIFLYNDIVA